ncbi:MAG: transposase [Lentisphaeria bacterium]
MRKQYLSVSDIKIRLDSTGVKVSESYIWNVVRRAGFGRLPRCMARRESDQERRQVLAAPISTLRDDRPDEFTTSMGGILLFAHLIVKYRIDEAIVESGYPESKCLPSLQSVLSFLGLKLSGFQRYSHDDQWCMDCGLGLFAGMNVLPKTAWLSSYSFRVTRDMNVKFLKKMNVIWQGAGLAEGPQCLDFTTIPCWGEGSHLENNWSGKRGKALKSIQAALAHSPDTGIICYGDAGVRHDHEGDVVLEFLDFYRGDGGASPQYLVFDSKFTTYQNFGKLNAEGVKFLTVRRRGRNLVADIEALPDTAWKRLKVECAEGFRTLRVNDSLVPLKGYGGEVRQIAITGHGKIKPALLITNDLSTPAELLIRTYTRRWLVEKSISEQIYFFHLNRVSSSIVIKVDFDLTMSILAHNLYRLLARELTGYGQCESETLFNKFIDNMATIRYGEEKVEVVLKKKRELPLLLEMGKSFDAQKIPWMGNRRLTFSGATIS